MEWKSKIVCLALCLALCGASTASADVAVNFDPLVTYVDLGDMFTVDIIMDADPEGITGWGIDLNIINTNKIAQVGSPVIGPDWTPVFAPDGDELAGLATLADPEGVTGTSVLATITFLATQVGWTQIHASDDWPEDETEGFGIFDDGVISPAYYCGYVQVVPEPASLALLLIGGLVLRRRR